MMDDDNTIKIWNDKVQEARGRLEDADIGFVLTEGDVESTFEFIDSMDLRDADSLLKDLLDRS